MPEKSLHISTEFLLRIGSGTFGFGSVSCHSHQALSGLPEPPPLHFPCMLLCTPTVAHFKASLLTAQMESFLL
jgi:hypothetical protein